VKSGIKIEFIAASILASKRGRSKIGYILRNVRQDKIVVIDDRLTPGEEKMLIQETMGQIGTRGFSGIEVSALGTGQGGIRDLLIRMLGGRSGDGLTVIWPSHLVKNIKRDPKVIHLLAGGNNAP